MGDASKLPGGVPAIAELILEALENARIGVTITRDDGDGLRRLYTNQAVATIMGYPPDQLPDPLAAVAESERPRLQAMRERWLAGEPPPSSFTTLVARPDGTEVPVEIGLSGALHDGAPTTVAFVRDTSEITQIEAALRASEARFRKLAEAAPDSITVAIRGKLVYANAATALMLGMDSPEQVLSMSLADLVRDDELPLMMERLQRIANGERLSPYAYHSKRADGSPLLMEITSTMIEWEGQTAFLGYGRDITERRRIEDDLMQADRMATIGTMAAGVAHEINNPLTYVLLHLQRLRRKLPEMLTDPGAQRETVRILDEALEGGERVRTIVRDLLRLSRGASEDPHPLSPEAVLRSAIKIARTAMGNQIPVEFAVANDIPDVLADPARLGQVFINLLVNAMQSYDGSPPRDAKVEVRVAATNAVTIEIIDNGPGIPNHIFKRVFDPFFTTKPVGTGTGLGLPISRAIVDGLGGRMEIENRPTGGVCVRVMLPAASKPHAPVTEPPAVVPAGAKQRRALVVDDEQMVCRAIAAVLEESFEVTAVTDGQAALALLDAGDYDLMVCDINMPPPSGIDIYEQILERWPERADKVLFITGGAQGGRDQAFVEEHSESVVAKPFRIDELLSVALRTAGG